MSLRDRERQLTVTLSPVDRARLREQLDDILKTTCMALHSVIGSRGAVRDELADDLFGVLSLDRLVGTDDLESALILPEPYSLFLTWTAFCEAREEEHPTEEIHDWWLALAGRLERAAKDVSPSHVEAVEAMKDED